MVFVGAALLHLGLIAVTKGALVTAAVRSAAGVVLMATGALRYARSRDGWVAVSAGPHAARRTFRPTMPLPGRLVCRTGSLDARG